MEGDGPGGRLIAGAPPALHRAGATTTSGVRGSCPQYSGRSPAAYRPELLWHWSQPVAPVPGVGLSQMREKGSSEPWA